MRSSRSIHCAAVAVAALLVGAVHAGEFPSEWFWGKPAVRQAHDALVGKPAPPITVTGWRGEPVDLAAQRGKVVVVDFWATWCGPCVKAIPKNIEMVNELGEKGLVMVGIHDHRRGTDSLDRMIQQRGINYPVAVDQGGVSARAYALSFWPTYAVVDRSGIVRAVGLQPQHVRAVAEKLLAEPAPTPSRAAAPTAEDRGVARVRSEEAAVVVPDVPEAWLEGDATKRRRYDRLAARPAPPALPQGTFWMNSEPLDLAELKGKVVVLDFWATWCGPCRSAIPKNNALHSKYAKDGLVFIGVCHDKGSDKMEQMAVDRGIAYPIVIDTGNRMIREYMVNGYPDYHVIDRHGRLRVIDCRNGMVEEVIKALLAEDPPTTAG